MFQEEDSFDFRDAATRRLISAELRRFSPDSVTVHPPDVVCRCTCVQSDSGTLDLASVQKIQAMGKLGVTRSRQTFGKKQVLGTSVIRQTWCHVRSPVGG